MTALATLHRRAIVVVLCLSLAALSIVTSPKAEAVGACPRNGKPLADGTYVESSPFGPRGNSFHRGVDLAGNEGTPIFAALDGTVADAGPASGFGQWIVVDSTTANGLVSTVYGHMYPADVLVRKGTQVSAGQHIANIGNNGQSSGPHLHFEYWEGGRLTQGQAVDPSFLLKAPPADPSVAQNVSASADCQIGVLKPGLVPPEFVPWLLKAGALCPGVTAPVLAAQLEAENGFRHGPTAPVSSTGAQGPAQFMPGTWSTWGKDYDGSGPPPDVNSIPDAVMSQGALMCENYRLCAAGIADGSIIGDPVALALAAYNAGFGAVQRNGGMPSGGEYTTQTQPYVYKILQRAQAFAAAPWTGGMTPSIGVRGVTSIVDAATEFTGKPWVWGGGDVEGPTKDGFDSAGLTFFAVAQGTQGGVVLPRTADQQWDVGKAVAMADVRPGDLVFSGWDSRGRPSHVGIAVGNGQMVHTDLDQGVVIADFYPDSRARRVT
ncbi:peptidoglycan DD-metalloendopeptidase family protein [Mycobacterium sp. Y57]|uniref:peptidoglycan DD-metalloendopeptidase family protein n=1 Tax=Mycolicibacterium xanthum TaxID=2796469 RepID=UPI001C84FA1F|nr:peptidoglycan DD-metalloendopeptidase family protein [Mycolicibacterium xanthum]MBX7432783.1 peptidoglycan DD-metalloendopeptidase family protein [Mycolicibacterium xanthum]